MKKNILVTGGAGFIGSNFCNINKEKYNITVLDNLFLGDKNNLDPKIKFIKGDACELKDLQKCGHKFDVVIHFAGTSSAPMFLEDDFVWAYANSIKSFTQTLEFARQIGVERFLYASTSSLYDDKVFPLTEDQYLVANNHYAVTKHCYENCAICYHRLHPEMDIIGFRFMSVYGPNEEAKGRYANVLSQFIWDFARYLSPIIYGDGEQFRDFTNVEDIVQALSLVIEKKEKLGNKIYNIGTGQTCSLNKMIKIVAQKMKSNIKPIYVENPVKENYIKGQCADISKISHELGFVPMVDLETGIERQIKNLKLEKIRETSSDFSR